MGKQLRQWIFQVVVALDQLGSALTGGWADETISSRLYRLDEQGSSRARALRMAVDSVASWFGQDRHCFRSYQAERIRAQLPPEMRL